MEHTEASWNDPETVRAWLAYWDVCGITFLSGETPGFSNPDDRHALRTPRFDIEGPEDTQSATSITKKRPSESRRLDDPAQGRVQRNVADAPYDGSSPPLGRQSVVPFRGTTASPPPAIRLSSSPAPLQKLAIHPTEPIIPVPPDQRAIRMAALEAEIAQCQKCPLALTRTQTVPGVGNLEGAVAFVGEAPGRDEDLQGAPFVGAAGHLLNGMMHAVGLRRTDVYILNVLKCRPPGNRTPSVHEMALCQHFLIRQLEIIAPRVIFVLGKVAVHCLLGHTGTMYEARGKRHAWRGIPVLVGYHPSYLLRQPINKKLAWQDLLMLQALLEETP
jgi:DNA polymerase